MKFLKKIMILLFVGLLALVLVACTTEEPEPEEQQLPAPTELKIELSIFDGPESSPYVLVGNKMYLDVVVDDGADDSVTWEISNAKATLETEDNRAVITGVSGGTAVVTATSTKNTALKDSITIEIVDTANFNDALVAAKAHIEESLPTYAASNFELPKVDNDVIKVAYRSGKNVPWNDGVFPYSTLYSSTVGDTIYAFYVKLTYHGVVLDTQLTIKMVADINANDFTAIEYAKKAITEAMAHVVDNGTQKFGESTTGGYMNASTKKYTIDIHGDFTAEEAGQLVSITVAIDDATAPLSVTKNESGSYALGYSKPLVDTRVQVDVYIKSGTNNDIVKLFIVAEGYQPDEILQYFISQSLCPAQEYTLTKSFFQLYATDKTKKFTKVSVKWTVEDEDLLKYNEKNNVCTKASATAQGETTLTGVFYYGYSERKIMVDVLDEQGNLVKNEDGTVKQEEVIQEVYTWKQEYKFHIIVK